MSFRFFFFYIVANWLLRCGGGKRASRKKEVERRNKKQLKLTKLALRRQIIVRQRFHKFHRLFFAVSSLAIKMGGLIVASVEVLLLNKS